VLSHGLPTEKVDVARPEAVLLTHVDSIDQVDTNYWFSDDFWPPTVRLIVEQVQLIQEVDPSYPIILGPGGRVMDGMHRVARAMLTADQLLMPCG